LFLERAVAAKEDRLRVLQGINRLDDIARDSRTGKPITNSLGEWVAEHNDWLTENGLRSSDARRISQILSGIKTDLTDSGDTSPVADKLRSEINRLSESTKPLTQKLVLKRSPENREESAEDSITLFEKTLNRISLLYADSSGPMQHILSVLKDCLQSARQQKNKDALLLSAFIIYYLRLDNYRVDPYVKMLKEAESTIKGENAHA
jgi:hypothetical protein